MTWGPWGGFSDSSSVDEVSIPEGQAQGPVGGGLSQWDSMTGFDMGNAIARKAAETHPQNV